MTPRREPIFTGPPITLALAVLLGLVFALLNWGPPGLADALFEHLVVVPDRIAAALASGRLAAILAEVPSLAGHALIHLDGLHVATNAGFLLAFGSLCERRLGPWRYVLLLLVSAIAGALVQILWDWGRHVVMFGASGAVSGCMGATVRFLLAAPHAPRRRMAVNLLVVLIGFNIAAAFFGGALFGLEAEIAWQAHAGGFIAGFLLGRSGARG
jgi:membrane associated rhomboid family serine protease